ncbi:hypothetical protein [Aneurinibacillus migulanus]|uniref:hypothetical protein n=1 Tax=Aneurinibacillus migulanus TaxID=47500 RepID=UPI001F1B37DB|nr:hypothetical protein [Aneurinibacillus migulanus]
MVRMIIFNIGEGLGCRFRQYKIRITVLAQGMFEKRKDAGSSLAGNSFIAQILSLIMQKKFP